jgi:prepilin-type processing-associated H-X9-DG protein
MASPVLDYRRPDTGKDRPRWWHVKVWEYLAVAVIIVVLVGLLLPSRGIGHPSGLNARCRVNLWSIGRAYQAYAARHGAAPGSFLDVTEGLPQGQTARVLVCPASTAKPLASTQSSVVRAALNDQTHANVSYVFVSNLPSDWQRWTPQIVVAFEPLSNHGNGMNVLFGDGHVEWLTSNGKDGPADKLVADYAAGVAPLVKR